MSTPITLKSLDERVTELAAAVEELKEASAKKKEAALAPFVEANATPVPADYRQVVDDILNPAFGIRIEPHTDAPLFTFTIVVPARYSTVKEGEDIRPKVFSFADGAAGVREWSQRVFGSFDPETKARIVADRVTFITENAE